MSVIHEQAQGAESEALLAEIIAHCALFVLRIRGLGLELEHLHPAAADIEPSLLAAARAAVTVDAHLSDVSHVGTTVH
jgi:hypothetical protein